MSNYARAEMPAVYSYTEFTNYEFLIAKAIPHNSKCRYGERGAADAKPKAQIILDAAKVSTASGGCGPNRSRGRLVAECEGLCPRKHDAVPQPTLSSILATQMPCRSCRSGA